MTDEERQRWKADIDRSVNDGVLPKMLKGRMIAYAGAAMAERLRQAGWDDGRILAVGRPWLTRRVLRNDEALIDEALEHADTLIGQHHG